MGFHSKTISFLCALNISLWWPTARLTSGSWGMENNYPSMLTPPAWGPSQTKCTVLYLPQKHLAARCVYLLQKHLAASVSTYCKNILLSASLPTTKTSCYQCIYLPQKHLAVTTTRTDYYTSAYLLQETSCCHCNYHKNSLLPLSVPTTGNILLPVCVTTTRTVYCTSVYLPQETSCCHCNYHENSLLHLSVPTTGNLLPVCVTTTRTVYCTSVYLPQETSCCRWQPPPPCSRKQRLLPLWPQSWS